MITRTPLWLLLLAVTVLLLSPAACYHRGEEVEEEEEEEEEERIEGRRGYGRREGEDLFLLQDSKRVIQTDAGEMRVVRTFGGRIIEKPMHIGFITMEPKSLFIPQYLDSSLILFVRRGSSLSISLPSFQFLGFYFAIACRMWLLRECWLSRLEG